MVVSELGLVVPCDFFLRPISNFFFLPFKRAGAHAFFLLFDNERARTFGNLETLPTVHSVLVVFFQLRND